MLENSPEHPQPDTFDLLNSPIAGVNLIDASAGTGKTYTICGLVLRLLLEKNLTLEQILVVTYTEAATEDLRHRIRQQLLQALAALRGEPADDFLNKYTTKIADTEEAARRLSDALRSFDEAAIFTIHGFCQRMLLENSFESNSLFDTELAPDDSSLIKEIIEDFWRRFLARSSSLFCRYVISELTPAKLFDFLAPLLPHPFLQFAPEIGLEVGCSSQTEIEEKYSEAFTRVCLEWTAHRTMICDDLLHSPKLKRNRYNAAAVSGLIDELDVLSASDEPTLHLPDRFNLITADSIRSGTKKNQTPHILRFYELSQDLMQTREKLIIRYDDCLLAFKEKLWDSLEPELKSRKARDNIFSFDDLLRRLHEALQGPSGIFLAQTIARKFPAALIDEFQDTDPLQYEIIKAIYKNDCLLFLIGDPKQAIYSFRGADIHTYMDAAAGYPVAHHTLGVNYRSAPALVNGVNSVFSRAANPFIYDTISFQAVAAATGQVKVPLTVDDRQDEPLIIHCLTRNISGGETASAPDRMKMIPKTGARSLIISRVTAEIARLLRLAAENRICFDGRNLAPGDIAVLVRKNDEARKMQQALAGVNITSVLHSGEDLFAAEEAKEMKLLLTAIVSPSNLRQLKTALLIRFIGLKPAEVYLLQADTAERERILEHWLGRFRNYHELWSRYGFMRMFWSFMQENRVRQRLLRSENGERLLTNLLHLAEILHQEAVNRGLSMTGLLSFLQQRITEDQAKNMEYQLRLESDEARVKIVTIHKAKGLQYPVVFCPFTWEGTRLKSPKGCLFHRCTNHRKTELVYDAGSPELAVHLQLARQEELSENLRLLYVALTRAVHRCYLYWGPINGAETSAPAYLLHQNPADSSPEGAHPSNPDILMKQTAARFLKLSDEEIMADLQELAAASDSSIRITSTGQLPQTYPDQVGKPGISLECRRATARIADDWKISSFSSLTAPGAAAGRLSTVFQEESADRDALAGSLPKVEIPEAPETEGPDIFSFPRGAKPGIFLHELLEQADFSSSTPLAEHLITEKLLQFGYETFWLPVLTQMLNDLGSTALHQDTPGLKLSSVVPTDCLHELEFYYPLTRISPDDLRSLFKPAHLKISPGNSEALLDLQLDRLIFAPSRGFMRGFIDLVFAYKGKFYLADWKSNYLGPGIESYGRDRLGEAVVSGNYFLQYYLYCLALHLYLEKRLPEYDYVAHFGGVFYVFLRGVKPELGPDYGIYYALPPFEAIAELRGRIMAV